MLARPRVQRGFQASHYAAFLGRAKILRELLQHKADPELEDSVTWGNGGRTYVSCAK